MFSGLDESELNIVIDAMDIKEAKNSEVVITQGDDGDVLYLLGNGLLDCHWVLKKGEEPTFLKTYNPGEAFGELALLYNAPRAATITAKVDSTLYSLDWETFNAIVKDQARKKRDLFEGALKKVKILTSISAYERSQIADAIRTDTYQNGEIIIKEGDPGNVFYMIMEG